MVATTFNKDYLFKLLGLKLDDKRLFDQTTKMGIDVENLTESEVSIDVPANRPDLIDIVGFARALKNFMHRSKKLRYEIRSKDPALEIDVGKEVSATRPFISGMVVRNLKLDEESLKHIINFTEKLSSTYGRDRRKLAIGMHNLDTIEPPLYYNAFKEGEFIPLNKSKEMKFSEVIQRHEKGVAYAQTIARKGRIELYPALKDSKGFLSLIPIINSNRTRVTPATKNLLVDITGTSRYTVEKSADLFAAMFIDLGAEVYRIKVSYTNSSVLLPRMSGQTIEIPLIRIEGQIGVVMDFYNVISLANKMGYEAALIGKAIRFRVPEYRLDVINDQDIIEDIAIAYGYDFIQPVPVYAEQMGELEESSDINTKLSNIMVGLGFDESLNMYLTNEAMNFDRMRVDSKKSEYVKIKDAKMREITMLRTWLLPSLLENIGASLHERMPQKLFELDLVFNISKGMVDEKYHLAAVLTDPKANFNQVKAIVQEVFYNMNTEYKIKEIPHKSFIEGRCAGIIVEGREAGVFGEVHPEVLNNFKIEEPTFALEIFL